MESAAARRARWVRRAIPLTAALVAAYVCGWLWGWDGGRLARPVSDAVALACAAAGSLLALGTARRLTGPARRAWWLFGLGMLSWTVAEALYGWYDVIAPSAQLPFPGPADVGYLAAYAFIGAGLLMLPSAPSRSFSRLRWALDGVLLAGALVIVSWAVAIGPALHSDEGAGLLALVVALAYPVGDLLLVALALSGLRRARFGGQLSVRLLVTAVLLTAVADTVYLVQTLHSDYNDGSPLDLGWYLCYVLVGVAGLAYQPDVHPDSDQPLQGTALAGPFLVFAGTVPFLGWQYWRTGGFDAVTVTTAGICGIGLCLRQWLTSRDNAGLTAALAGQQRELRQLAFQDSLTGLPNRALLMDRIEQGLAGRAPRLTAVLLIDLDGFKNVNDTYGHAAGDELLVAVARRLRAAVRPQDTVTRLGGDEFAIVMEAAEGAEPVAPLTVAERICVDLRGGYRCSFAEVFVTGSVGVALRGGTETGDILLRNADLAMYESKARGGNAAWIYQPDLHEAVLRRHALESELRLALGRSELAVAYQPVVQLPLGTIVGVEALMRWDSPIHGVVSPSEFIPIAESSGLLGGLDAWLLGEACAQLVAWRDEGHELTLAVNASIRQVQTGAILPTISEALARTGLPAGALSLEITEGVLLDDTECAITVLDKLRALGVRVALDDFGTGYSSLSYLATLPVDRIKIDRSVVAGLGEGPRLRVLTEAAVWMGRRLGMEIVAEGVETVDQVGQLVAMGCQLAQGFYYSPPLLAADCTYRIRASAASLESVGLVRQALPLGR